MTRSRTYHLIPHALLLAGAAIGLSLTANAPQDLHAPSPVVQADEQTKPALEYDRPYMDAQGHTRSIGEIIRQVRARMNRIQQTQADTTEKELNAPKPLSSLVTDTPHRRMVRNQDIEALPKVTNPSNTPTVHYVETVGSPTPQTSSALGVREYTVLGFGEVGQDQPAVSTSDIHTVVPTAQSTDVARVFTGDAEIDTAFLSAALPTAEARISPQSPASVDTLASPVTPVAAMQAASVPTPEPLTSLAAVPTTRSDSEQVAAQNLTQSKIPTDTRTRSLGLTAQNAFTNKAQPNNDTPSTARVNPTAETDRSGSEISLAKTPLHNDKQAPTTPTAHKVKPKAETHPVFPVAPKELASVKPKLDKHDDPTTPSPATTKTTSQSTNPLLVYIDGHDKIGSDRVNAIDSALSRINQAVKKADLDVELKITTDKRSNYNIHFTENDGKDMGNKLGLAEFAVTQDTQGNEYFLGENSSNPAGQAKVSINNAFNWFAGDDDDAIDDDEFDYQTAVAHEFLHLLGLDDDFDNPAAVSHGLLSPGQTRRDLDDHDIFGLTDIYTRYNPWQSSFNPSSWSNGWKNGWGNNWGKTRYHAKALTAAVVPEPATLGLIGLGVLGVLQVRKR